MPFDIMGIRIPTIWQDNIAVRCRGCSEPIDGEPFRVSVMDIAATEIPAGWESATPSTRAPTSSTPRPTASGAGCASAATSSAGGRTVRELMRPIAVPGDEPRWGLCDGLHRDDHELIPA